MDRKERILAILAEHGPSRTEDIRQAIAQEMTRQSFWLSLKAMQAEGLVTPSGAGPSSRWLLQGPSAMRLHLETPWERRRAVEYDMSLSGYAAPVGVDASEHPCPGFCGPSVKSHVGRRPAHP